MTSINDVFRWAFERGVSDLHLAAEQPPWIRKDGKLSCLDLNPCPAGRLEEWLSSLLDSEQLRRLFQRGRLLQVRPYRAYGRVRLQVVRQRQGWSVAARLIPARTASLAELGLPPIMATWTQSDRGLVVIAGLAGSGRSTTAAAWVQHATSLRPRRVRNRETAPEFVVSNQAGKCDLLMIPRLPTEHWERAIAQASRRLVVAICDGVDVWNVLQAAVDSPTTQTAEVLLGVTVQQLLPQAHGSGRVCAVEVMVNNQEISDLLRRRSLFRLANVMQNSAAAGMKTMEQALWEKVQGGEITREVALGATAYPGELQQMLERSR